MVGGGGLVGSGVEVGIWGGGVAMVLLVVGECSGWSVGWAGGQVVRGVIGVVGGVVGGLVGVWSAWAVGWL